MRRLIVVPLLLISFAAGAADVESHSKIASVTIFPNSALIGRLAGVDLPAGPSRIIFKNLPIALDPASIQVSGRAASGLVIGAVMVHREVPEIKPDTEMDARLKELQKQRAAVQITLDALSVKKSMIIKFSAAGPEKIGPEARPLDVADWTKAWDEVQGGLVSTGKEFELQQTQAHELDDKIAGIIAAQPGPNTKSQPSLELSVDVESAQAATATLILNYLITGASWYPEYEARLSASDLKHPELAFKRRAAVSQKTGEDWTGVELTVSTLRVERGMSLPEIMPQVVRFREPPVILPGPAIALKSNRSPAPGMGLAQADRMAPGIASAPMEAATKEAELDADNFNAAFKIPGLTTVLSDGRVETFQISSRNVTPDLSFFTVPAVDSRAFIQGQIANEKDAPLLPGKVLIYRDGSYLGTAHIDFVAANDSFDLSFGADDKIKIIRNPVTIKETEPYWYNQSKSVARLFSTIVENLHDFPIKINLLDALPVSESNSISVEQLPDTVVAQQKPVADKRGVVSWVYNYEPHERREIRFGYRMKWPAERDVIVEQIHQSK